MTNLDELEKKKRELELRRDIAKLERQERISTVASQATSTVATRLDPSRWSWWWVGPLGGLGAYLAMWIYQGMVELLFAGVLLMVPAAIKLLKR